MIVTKRCNLIRLQESDYDDVKKLYVNHEVRRYLGGTIDDDNILKSKLTEILKNSNIDSIYLIIRLIDSNEFIGLASLDKYHDSKNTEISYQFLPQWWGTGIATEVIGELIDYAFCDLGLDKLVAETQTANVSSCKLLEKVGMKIESNIKRFGAEQTVYSIERSLEKTQERLRRIK